MNEGITVEVGPNLEMPEPRKSEAMGVEVGPRLDPVTESQDPRRMAARKGYVEECKTLPQLASSSGIDVQTLMLWAEEGKWPAARSMAAEARMREADSALQTFQSDQMLPTAERHMSLASLVEEKLKLAVLALDPIMNPKDIGTLCNISRALSYVTPVSSKASGLEVRTNEIARAQADKQAGPKRVPLVAIGFNVTVSNKDRQPPSGVGKVLEVTSVDLTGAGQ